MSERQDQSATAEQPLCPDCRGRRYTESLTGMHLRCACSFREDELNQSPARRRRGTTRALIEEYLAAGWTDLEKMWTAIERDHPSTYIGWAYLRRVAREWKETNAHV